jgi:nucleolar protein 14
LHVSLQAQKAKEREEDEHLVDKLDSDFSSLAQSQALLSLTESAKGKVNKNDSSTGLTGKEIFGKVVIFLKS